MNKFRSITVLLLIAVLLMVAAQCGTTASPEKVVETVVVTKEVQGQNVEVVKTVEVEKQVAAKVTNLNVWAEAGPVEHWRADGPMKAAAAVNKMLEEKGDPQRITVVGTNDDTGWSDYKKKFILAADAGQAPQIIVSEHADIPVLAKAGYIFSLDQCRKEYKEFDDVIDNLWSAASWNGHVWGVPQDTEARPFFYNKPLLTKLGWSDADIEALPEKIKSGQWTLEDMFATGKEAVAKGIVKPGNVYWHRPVKGGDFLMYYTGFGGRLYDEKADKLVISKDALNKWYAFMNRLVAEKMTPQNYIGTEWSIWDDTLSHGKVLFFTAGTWNWSDWAVNVIPTLGGEDYLFKNFGFALQPATAPGNKPNTLSEPLVYMITSPKANGSDTTELACALLAKTTTPEINNMHALGSSHLGILKSQSNDETYKSGKFLAENTYLLDYTFFEPNHIQYGPYFDILFDNMVKAESGELAPDKAAEAAISSLQAEIGDSLIVE
jgi:inositol-phosphate transport system substrate-binding protein